MLEVEGYKGLSELTELYNLSGYGLGSIVYNKSKLNKLIELGEIEAMYVKEVLYISTDSLERYLGKIDNIRRDFIPLNQFVFELTGIDTREGNQKYVKHVMEFVDKTCLEILTLEIPITNGEKHFINKKSFEKFKQSYISVLKAFNEFNPVKDIGWFKVTLEKQGIEIIPFMKRHEFMYVNREDLNDYQEFSNGVIAKQVMKELEVSDKVFYYLINEYKIRTQIGKNGWAYISKKDYEFLIDLQNRTYKDLELNHYTFEELELLLKEAGSTHMNEGYKKGCSIGIPEIARKQKFKYKFTLYSKKEIDKYINNLIKEKEIALLRDSTESNYDLLLKQVLEIENVNFSENAQITQDYWFKYAFWKLRNLQGNKESNMKRVSNFRGSTKVLVEFTQNREIYNASVRELNLFFFNDKIPAVYQKEIYYFLQNINENLFLKFGRKIFDLNKIGLKRYGESKAPKEIYTIDEYLSLNSYVADYELHKQLSILDIKQALSDKKKYRKHDSFWLYVLLHMNNGWRKCDVIHFPRFRCEVFDEIDMSNIDALERLKLTNSQAERIVKFYEIQWYEHNKTKEKAKFYCSSLLTMAMAYAIVICEFRCRLFHTSDEKILIHFYNKKNDVSDVTQNHFFKEYKPSFKFLSRKMNRSVLTYTSSVIRNALEEDPLKISQHLRGHGSSETTNGYITIPQQHLDFIVEQLFDKGFYGFVYDKVNNLLTEESDTKGIEQNNKPLEVKALLGDIVKLEDTSAYLNYLSKEREELGEYLGGIPKEELKRKINLINLGLFPAKQENYQCFFGECIAKKIDCDKCAFAIPNFYALSVISKRIKRTLYKYQKSLNERDVPIGEKNKLYNLLLLDYLKIMEAKEKFGLEIIEMFMDLDVNDFSNLLDCLPEPESLSLI